MNSDTLYCHLFGTSRSGILPRPLLVILLPAHDDVSFACNNDGRNPRLVSDGPLASSEIRPLTQSDT